MKIYLLISSLLLFSILILSTPVLKNQPKTDRKPASSGTVLQANQEQIKRGEHLVLTSACHDCHTPKKMTDKGPVMDYDRAFSGHPANEPAPDVNRKEMEQKGLIVTSTLTAWVGPWGISYAANLTSDATGIGKWTEKQFFTAIREGKYKGLENSRMLLPPMPWDMYKNMTDEELRAIFAYLKSTKPIKNVVPAPTPPVTAATGK